MIRKIIVKPWSVDFIKNYEYDALIATVGYERRARYIAKFLEPKSKYKVASAFAENKVLDFQQNLQWFNKAGFETPQHSSSEFKNWAYEIIYNLIRNNNETSRMLIDISSMSRYRIAALVWPLASCLGKKNLWVDFVYALAKYNPPPSKTGPIIKMGPVLPEFAGWLEDPGAPCSAIMGLGYDLGKSVSTIEYIEPGDTRVMFPIGEDESYEKSVIKANKIFIDTLDSDRIIDYDVLRPFETFQRLESLISGTLRSSRPIIIPFGPKIFTLSSLLVALLEYPKVSIWRVSSDKYEKVANRLPSGTVVGLRIEFLGEQIEKEDKIEDNKGG